MNAALSYEQAVEKLPPLETVYVLDLHGYPVWQAVELATQSIRAAYEAGFEFIKLIHGAPDIRHHLTAQVLGRGGIKWSLRGCLSRGEWSDFVYSRRSSKHVIDDGSMTLKLRTQADMPQKADCSMTAKALSLDEMQRLFDETAERNEERRRAIAECMKLFDYKGYLQACKESAERLKEKKR